MKEVTIFGHLFLYKVEALIAFSIFKKLLNHTLAPVSQCSDFESTVHVPGSSTPSLVQLGRRKSVGKPWVENRVVSKLKCPVLLASEVSGLVLVVLI